MTFEITIKVPQRLHGTQEEHFAGENKLDSEISDRISAMS